MQCHIWSFDVQIAFVLCTHYTYCTLDSKIKMDKYRFCSIKCVITIIFCLFSVNFMFLHQIFSKQSINVEQRSKSHGLLQRTSNLRQTTSSKTTFGLKYLNAQLQLNLSTSACESQASDLSTCEKYNREIHYDYTVFTNYHSATILHEYNSNDVITLVTQLTATRIESLKRIASVWRSSISAVVYVNKTDFAKTQVEVEEWLRTLQPRLNVAVTYVIKRGVSIFLVL